MSNLFSLYTV